MKTLILLIVFCLNIQIFICSNTIFDQKSRILKELSHKEETCLYALLHSRSQSTRVKLYSSPCRRFSQIPELQILIPTNSEGRQIYPDRIQVNQSNQPLSSISETEDAFDNYFGLAFKIIRDIKNFYGINSNVKPFLFFRASSGIRLEAQEKQQKILNLVRKTFRKQKNFYFLDDSWATVVRKEEESQFLWLSVNYAFKKIKNQPLNQFSVQNTVAVIEMGNAYSQIAYSSSSEYNKFLDLPEKTRVKIHTDLLSEYGTDQVIRQILSYENRNSCYQKTSGFTHQLSDINGNSVQVQGNYDFFNCTNLILNFMGITNCYYSKNSKIQDCSISSKMKQLYDQKEIVGLSSIYFAKEGLYQKLKIEGDKFSLKDFRQQVKRFCSLKLKLEEFQDNGGTFNRCIELMWISTFLIDGLGLLNNQMTSVYFQEYFVLDWTLGSLLYDMSKIQCDFIDVNQCTDEILLSDILDIKNTKYISKPNSSQIIFSFCIVVSLLIVNLLI
ncbi:hypothetical protein ABPG72_014341 [Tetrahymena utriculariae]